MNNSKFVIAKFWIIMFSLQFVAVSQGENIDKTIDFNLRIAKSINDSVVTFYYSAPVKMFVELSIFNRQGYIVDVPLSKELNAGEDSLKVSVGYYNAGTYTVGCKINHFGTPKFFKMFRHAERGQYVTYSTKEIKLHNELPACDQTVCKVSDLSKYDQFLKKYPCYIDKGEVFQRALLAYVKLNRDSILISRTIDSLVAYLPNFYTYYKIARYLSEYNKLSSIVKKYLLEARDRLTSIPPAQQSEYNGRLSEIEKTFKH